MDGQKQAVYYFTSWYDPERDPKPAPEKLDIVKQRWGELEVEVYYIKPELNEPEIDYSNDSFGVYPFLREELYTVLKK